MSKQRSLIWRSRPFKLSISLLLLTVSVLFSAEFFHLRGDQHSGVKEIRKTIAETLAVQLSTLASVSDMAGVRYSVSSFVTRNDTVLAAALVTAEDGVVSQYGQVELLGDVGKGSNATHLNVPIFHSDIPWGDVQVVFKKPETIRQDIRYFVYILFGCFISYILFLYRALVNLDPSRVVPARVNSAFNMFSEGVVILDKNLRILLANESMADTIGASSDNLVGQSIDEWEWQKTDEWRPPWRTALDSGTNVSDQPLRLFNEKNGTRLFMVSCSAIGDGDDGMRGVMVTFDNMTAIETKNKELAATLKKLRRSQEFITQKNKELENLATRDPLTGLANRRSLLEFFEREFNKSRRENLQLSCLMLDIDNFKEVNDSLGHAAGDEVICAVSSALTEQCRDYDMVGRYGGEEFVLVLPGLPYTAALELAERVRMTIEALGENAVVPVPRLTASIGVSELSQETNDVAAIIEQADQALYAAKQGGRNRVVAFSKSLTVFAKSERSENVTQGNFDSALTRVAELEAIVDRRTRDLANLREYDALTHTPKQPLFLHRVALEMQRADRYGNQIGLLSMEIRDLNRVLSTFGQSATDGLIVDFVQRIQIGLRRTDLVSTIVDEHSLSRITSNEYGILLTDLDEFGQTMSVITRLRRQLSDPFPIAGHKIYIGASIGIALYPQGADTPSELLDAANLARAEAKSKSDKITHAFASGSLDQSSRDYIQLETDIYEAFEKNQFDIYFQPKFELEHQRIRSLETLVRWEHPTRGFVSPELFIPIVEANGLIQDLSDFVLARSLKYLNIWRVLGNSDLQVSVNISPIQLREPSLVEKIKNTLDEAGIPGTCLEVELTETSVIESPARAQIVLQELRALGIRISMDDFGTGYTSLALLADLALDAVKIDRSFVSAIESSEKSRAIVESVINMAQALNLWVVAEGVETEAQMDTLYKLGCDEIQGYLYARPMPADKTLEFLQNNGTLPGVRKSA